MYLSIFLAFLKLIVDCKKLSKNQKIKLMIFRTSFVLEICRALCSSSGYMLPPHIEVCFFCGYMNKNGGGGGGGGQVFTL